MTELELTWELPTAGLLGLAAAAVAVLLVLIIGARVHAFLALVLVSALTALAAGVPFEAVVPTMLSGFGGTLAAVALLVGLGAMLGRMLELSGGAQVLTDALVQRFGEDRAPLALGIASLLMGFPIFFDAGLVVMLPIIFAVARRLGGSVLTYAFPAAVAFSVMHIFVPPHPGPVAASGLLGADVGLVVLLGLLIAIPAWILVGRVFGGWVGRTYDLPVPEILRSTDHDDDAAAFRSDPTVRTTLSLLALPLFLIFLNTGLNALATAEVVSLEDGWVRGLRLLGETPVALLITVFVAMYVLAWRHG
ncbi:MAG: SLC13 family permease, partial [Actinomycetota bacterium]|nr:SLC13 family permease [Actinomycetota bacterium]